MPASRSCRLFRPMCLGHLGHALEVEMHLRRLGDFLRRPAPLATEPAVDPGARQAGLRCRHMIMVEALRGVQHLVLRHAEIALQVLQEILEVARIGLIGADVLL